MSASSTVEPEPNAKYGEVIVTVKGAPFLQAWPGGTGPCWNFAMFENGEPGEENFHVCELDEMIDALVALRDSAANRANVERWA